jgi:hypothetical protein
MAVCVGADASERRVPPKACLRPGFDEFQAAVLASGKQYLGV